MRRRPLATASEIVRSDRGALELLHRHTSDRRQHRACQFPLFPGALSAALRQSSPGRHSPRSAHQRHQRHQRRRCPSWSSAPPPPARRSARLPARRPCPVAPLIRGQKWVHRSSSGCTGGWRPGASLHWAARSASSLRWSRGGDRGAARRAHPHLRALTQRQGRGRICGGWTARRPRLAADGSPPWRAPSCIQPCPYSTHACFCLLCLNKSGGR